MAEMVRSGFPESLVPDLDHRIERQDADREARRCKCDVARIQARLDHRKLRPEAGEGREAGKRQSRNQEQYAQHRHGSVETAGLLEIEGSARAIHDTRDQEQVGLHDDVVDHVEDGPADRQGRGHRNAEQHVADLADDMEREDAAHVEMGGRAQNARHHREDRDSRDDRPGVAGIAIEQQREGSDDGVDADLGQQRCKDGHDRRGCCVVGRRQPVE